MRWAGWCVLALATTAGCIQGPQPGNPLLVYPFGAPVEVENPLFSPLGPTDGGYDRVFNTTYDVVLKYFEVARSSRPDGLIETWPILLAGYSDPLGLKYLYDSRESLESTLQTIRRRCLVRITPAEMGGYFIAVTVFKEIEDLPRPAYATSGDAMFRPEIPIERQVEVIDQTAITRGWIPFGRDHALEQRILCELKSCL